MLSKGNIAVKIKVGMLFGASGLDLYPVSTIYGVIVPDILNVSSVKRNGTELTKVDNAPSSNSEYSLSSDGREIRVYDDTGYYVAEMYVFATNTDSFRGYESLSASTGDLVKWVKKLTSIGGVSYSIENAPAGFLEVGGSSVLLQNGENEFSFLESNYFSLSERECVLYSHNGSSWLLLYDGISSAANINRSTCEITVREKLTGLKNKYTCGDTFAQTVVTTAVYPNCPESNLFKVIPYYQCNKTRLFYDNSKVDDSTVVGEVTVPPDGASKTIQSAISSTVIVGKADSATTTTIRKSTALTYQAITASDTSIYAKEETDDKFFAGEWAIVLFDDGQRYQIVATNTTVLFGDGVYRKFLVDSNAHSGISSSYIKSAYSTYRFSFAIFANTQRGKCSLAPVRYTYIPSFPLSGIYWEASATTTTSGKKIVSINKRSGATNFAYCTKDGVFYVENFGKDNTLDFDSIEVYYQFSSSRKKIGAAVKQVIDDFGISTVSSSFSSFDSSYPMDAAYSIYPESYSDLPSGVDHIQNILKSIGCYLYRDSSYSIGISKIDDMSSPSSFGESKINRDSESLTINFDDMCYSVDSSNDFFPELSTEYSVTNPVSFYLTGSSNSIENKMYTTTLDSSVLESIIGYNSSNKKLLTFNAHNDAITGLSVGSNITLESSFIFAEKDYKIVNVNNGESETAISISDFGA